MLRVFNGYNKNEINKGLLLFEEVTNNNKDVKTQMKEFCKRTNKSRSTFYRYKSFLKRKRDTIGNQKYQKQKEKSCYFCGKEEKLVVHHLNFIHEDNKKENLITLCSSCHTKIHLVAQKVAQMSKSRSDFICEEKNG